MDQTRFPMGSEKDVQAWIAVEQKPEGNIGAEIVVNPVLYKNIVTNILQSDSPLTIADFGAGSGSLAIDLLLEEPASKPALALLGQTLLDARNGIDAFICLDVYESLLQSGKRKMKQYGPDAEKIQMVQNDLTSDPLPFQKNTIDLAVSRHFFMHLTHEELEHHLQEAHRVLKSTSSYYATILNPAYEDAQYKRKYPELPSLVADQKYDYVTEHSGHRYTQESNYRPLEETLRLIGESGFTVETEFLTAKIPGYEELYPRYYDATVPVSVLLKMNRR